jgi:hypothetical protein
MTGAEARFYADVHQLRRTQERIALALERIAVALETPKDPLPPDDPTELAASE